MDKHRRCVTPFFVGLSDRLHRRVRRGPCQAGPPGAPQRPPFRSGPIPILFGGCCFRYTNAPRSGSGTTPTVIWDSFPHTILVLNVCQIQSCNPSQISASWGIGRPFIPTSRGRGLALNRTVVVPCIH